MAFLRRPWILSLLLFLMGHWTMAASDVKNESQNTCIHNNCRIQSNSPEEVVFCTEVNDKVRAQEDGSNSRAFKSVFRSRMQGRNQSQEITYVCRTGNEWRSGKSVSFNDSSNASFTFEILKQPRLKNFTTTPPSNTMIRSGPNDNDIFLRRKVVVCSQIQDNDISSARKTDGFRYAGDSKDNSMPNILDPLPKRVGKSHKRGKIIQCSGGETRNQRNVLASLYIAQMSYKHRKPSEKRSAKAPGPIHPVRKVVYHDVTCFPAERREVKEDGSGKLEDSKNNGRIYEINRSTTTPSSHIKDDSNIRNVPTPPYTCESRAQPIFVDIKDLKYNISTTWDFGGQQSGRNSESDRIMICPSKQDIYGHEWRLFQKDSIVLLNTNGKLKNTFKFFKILFIENEANMICHLTRHHVSLKKTRRKRGIKGSPPQIMYTFLEQAVQPGGHISLKCSAAGDPPPSFEWKLDNQVLSASSHRYLIGQYMEHTGLVISHLNMTNVRVEDGGQYECKAVNAKGTSSHVSRLNVYGAPYIRSISVINGVTANDITIICPYYGYPISFVKWESSKFDLTSDSRYQSDGVGSLKIISLNPTKDAGGLTCSVGSPTGELAKRELQLIINSPPVLSPLSFPPNLKSGERAQLSCTVISGDMPVFFSWQKDGLPISASLQIEERNTEFFSYLLFKSLSETHSGVYTCTSSNSAGKVNKSTEFVIKVPPYWNTEPQDTSTLLGGSVMINCDSRGFPTPRTYWSKQYDKSRDNFDLISPSSEHLVVYSNGSFLINSVTTQDKGRYKCTAENGVEPSLEKSILLDVNEPARFDVASQNVSVKRGDTVSLICDIQGDNPVKNVWTHNNNLIDKIHYGTSVSESKREKGLRSQLTIERADRHHSGLFRCQASNLYGRSEHFIHLAVQERPDPPKQLEVIQVGSRSLTLSWQRPYDGNSPVLGYLLQYQALRSGTTNTWDVANTVNVTISTSKPNPGNNKNPIEQGVVNGLQPDTTYSMRMLAVNQIESSSYSETLVAKTHEEAPTEPPQNVQVQAGDSRELVVTWQAPPVQSWHGPLLGYTVHWAEVTEADLPTQQAPVSSSATVKGATSTKFTITGLGQFTKYRITVTAANRAGSGPASIPILGTTKEGVPTAPPQGVRCNPLSSQSLKVEWSPPPRTHIGGNLLGYKILYKPLTENYLDDTISATEVKRTSSSETYLHALLKYTNYSIQVIAYTGAGDGILSPPVYCTTEADIPGPPADMKAVAMSSESILVSWLPPKKPNGEIIFYNLYYREVGSGSPTTRQISVMEARELGGVGLGGAVEVRQLSEKTRYEFWLSASTGAGEGAAISPVTQVTTSRAAARLASFGGVAASGVGRPLTLGCLAVGNPQPRARWLHEHKPITHSHLYQVTPEGNLLIHSVETSVSGNYTCSAKNLFGSDEITYNVICLLPPGPPILQLLYATMTTVQLQWGPPFNGGSPILGYTLTYRMKAEHYHNIDLSAEILSYKVENLLCGSKYYFQIVSHNRVGKGQLSQTITVSTKGDSPRFPEVWSPYLWSNSSCVIMEVRRALSSEGTICPLLSIGAEWRRDGEGDSWKAASVPLTGPLILSSLPPAQWYEVRIHAENHAGRSESIFKAATTTLSGATLSPPENDPMVPAHPHEIEISHENNIFNTISIILAVIAALSTLSVIYLLIRKRNVVCNCNAESDYDERRRSQSQMSDEKTICAEQQNLRNSQHDYSPPKAHPEKLRREQEDMYEISPYATFQVGAPHRPVVASTLDHTLQFRTFGHMENDSPPLQAPCRRHYPQKSHNRHDSSKGEDSGCELLQPIRMRSRSRQGSGPSYCVPLTHSGEGFQAVLHPNSKSDIC